MPHLQVFVVDNRLRHHAATHGIVYGGEYEQFKRQVQVVVGRLQILAMYFIRLREMHRLFSRKLRLNGVRAEAIPTLQFDMAGVAIAVGCSTVC